MIEGEIPRSIDEAPTFAGVQAKCSMFWEPAMPRRVSRAAGCEARTTKSAPLAETGAALVVSRHGCAPAMPTAIELEYFLKRRPRSPTASADRIATGCSPICIG